MCRKLNFICIGTQKAATTALHDILGEHTSIFLPRVKEAKFFEEQKIYDRGYNNWYKENFSEAKSSEIIGLINPELLFDKKSPKRIFKTVGSDVKLIVILRNPVDRAFSHYLMTKRRGLESLTFEDALINESNLDIKNNEFNRKHFSYIARGKYHNQIKNYLKYFNKKNILFLNYEKDILNNLDITIINIQKFLNIKIEKLSIFKKSNVAQASRFTLINNLIFSKNRYLNSFVSIFLSKKMKKRLVSIIYKLNVKKVFDKEIDPKTRIKIMNKNFKEDYKKTLKIIT